MGQIQQSILTARDLSGAMVAIVTPMNGDGSIDWLSFERLVCWHIRLKTVAIIIAGTTGESALLNTDETKKLISKAVTLCADTTTWVVAGTGAISAQQVISNNQMAAECGAAACLVVTPYYLRLTQQALYDHFKLIADNSPLPVILYNVPGRTGNDLQSKTTKELALHPKIIAIKEAKSDMSRITELLKIDSFAVLSGDDLSFCEAMQLGAHGVISVAANVRPMAIQQICHATALGDYTKAKELNDSLHDLYELLCIEPNPGPVKAVMAEAKMLSSAIRQPLQLMSLTQTQLKRHLPAIKQEFTEA